MYQQTFKGQMMSYLSKEFTFMIIALVLMGIAYYFSPRTEACYKMLLGSITTLATIYTGCRTFQKKWANGNSGLGNLKTIDKTVKQ